MTAEAIAPPAPLDYPQEFPAGSGRYGPNARQELAHSLAVHADELLYGGARGGGKTDFVIAEALRRLMAVPGMRAVLFRRTYPELAGPGGAMERLRARIPRHVGRYHEGRKVWTFTNGSTLALSYLAKPGDVEAWKGLELQLMIFDQVEQLPEVVYRDVRTSLRVTGPVAERMRELGLRPASIATANPGGVGHGWVKRRFIDPFPQGGVLFRGKPTTREPVPPVRCFVPASLADNPALDVADPSYRRVLEALPDDERAAQLEGDWNVFKGARFEGFRTALHVLPVDRMVLPPAGTAPRGVGIDYGMTNPFVALWGVLLPDDVLLVYRELDGRGLTPAEQARAVLDAEADDERTPQAPMLTALDAACWTPPPDRPLPVIGGRTVRPTGPPPGSIADVYQRNGLPVLPSEKRRLESAARIAARLKPRPDGRPGLLIASTCTGLIETLPALQRDPRRPEDVLKSDDDHWYDSLRYLDAVLTGAQAGSPAPPPSGRSRPSASRAVPTTTVRGLRRRQF